MIYQLYPTEQKKNKPFNKFYHTICLEDLSSEYYPELKMEYSGMLYAWKNKLDNDDWIGFTSYQQLKKNKFLLNSLNYKFILRQLKTYDILSWRYICFPCSIAAQAEYYHKNILYYTELLLSFFDEQIPDKYYNIGCACYCGYWIMSKSNFNFFMEWSYPKIQKILSLQNSNTYFKIDQHLSNSGFIIERLFIIWYLIFNKSILNISKE